MGIFYANEARIIEFQKLLRADQTTLSTLQRKVSEVKENLRDQKGLGLGEVKMRIGNLSTAISNMSYRIRTYDTFLQKVIENTRDAENQNTKILMDKDSSVPKNSLDSLINGTFPQLRDLQKWILQNRIIHGSDPLGSNKLFDQVINGNDLEAFLIALPKYWEIPLKNIKAFFTGKGDYVTEYVEDSIMKTLESYSHKVPKYSEDEALTLAKDIWKEATDIHSGRLEKLLGEEKYKDSEWCKYLKKYKKVLKGYDWSKFTVNQIANLVTDYENSIRVLKSLKNMVDEGSTTEKAIDSLMGRYENKVCGVLEDIGEKFFNKGADKLLDAIVVPEIRAGLDIIFSATGMSKNSDNLIEAMALEIQGADIYSGYSKLKSKIVRGEATEQECNDFINTFEYLKEHKIGQYKILQEITKNSNIRSQIDEEIKKLKSYGNELISYKK